VYKYLYHSTVSNGHIKVYLKDFLEAHPAFSMADSVPRPGYFAISLESLMHPLDPEKLSWLRYHFEPYGTYRGTILLYHITPAQLQQWRQQQAAGKAPH
jgi:hypothetical protein